MKTNYKNIDDFLLCEDYNNHLLNRSSESQKKWDKFFKENPEAKGFAKKAQKIILGIDSLQDITSKKEVKEFQLQQRFEDAWNKYKGQKSKSVYKNVSASIWRTLTAAAALIIAVALYVLVNYFVSIDSGNKVYSQVYVPPAKQSQLILPDGSKVWVNSDSKIKYSNKFNRKERDIYLSGEAYFEVEDNKKIPFRVFANQTEIKVVGTKFNVRAYNNESEVEAILVDGKIEFSKNHEDGSKPLILSPGDKAIFNLNNHELIVSREDVETGISWKDGKLIFRNTSLSKVCKSLNRWYNAQITIEDEFGILSTHPFTFTIEDESVEQVLNYLSQAAPIEYKMIRNNNDLKEYMISEKISQNMNSN